MRRFASLAAVVLALTIGAERGRAAIVYSTLGPNNSYDTSGGSVIGGPNSFEGFFASGFSFSPSATVNLSQIDIAIGLITGANSFNLALRAADGASGGPGTVLESFTVPGRMGLFGNNNPLIGLDSTTHPMLQTGTTYWLVATADGDTVAAWNVTNQGTHGTYYSIQGGREVLIPDQLVGAYQVSGDVVPEPAGGALLAVGAVGLLAYGWRRRRPVACIGRSVIPETPTLPHAISRQTLPDATDARSCISG
jgi:hypothetical protein